MKFRFLILTIFTVFFISNLTFGYRSSLDHDSIIGEPAVSANVDELLKTIVTPTIDCPIQEGKNVVWCATMQVAWDQLREITGGPVRLSEKNKTADALNIWKFNTDNLDNESYIAMAGKGQTAISNIKLALKTKFKGASSPRYLPSTIMEDEWIIYSYLFQNLPFKTKFTRMKRPFTFAGKKVESFGIDDYMPDEKQMAKQVSVYDYRGADDFIVELKPSNDEHSIILAHIPPMENLADMVYSVKKRINNSEPTMMKGLATLQIPVINFDLLKTYSELENAIIKSSNPEIDGKPLDTAIQSIRFKLNESGAVLISEAMLGALMMPEQNLVFKNSFLVLLKKSDSRLPYLVVWIDNGELLTPFKSLKDL